MEDNHQETTGTSIWTKLKWVFYACIVGYLLYTCASEPSTSSEETTYEQVEIAEATEGVVTSVKEVQAEVYKITDEEIVPTVEESRIIASNLNGTIDTFTLDEVRLVDTTVTDRNDGYYRNRLLRSVVIGGVMGYMMGRTMGSPLSRGSYASDNSYNKSSTATRSRMASTARTRTVSRPTKSTKSGFGSSRSTRSYGG